MVNGSCSSCTRNGDNLSPLIKSGNNNILSMISQTIIRILKHVKGGGGNKVKKEVGAMMVVVFTTADISYLVVGLYHNLVRPLLFLYL